MTKKTYCYAIEPAENGWVVVETIFTERAFDNAGIERERPVYDPTAAFSGEEEAEQPVDPQMREQKVYVFGKHAELLAFIGEKTKPAA